jgi:hypothetical protein
MKEGYPRVFSNLRRMHKYGIPFYDYNKQGFILNFVMLKNLVNFS